MIPAEFTYYAAATLGEAVNLLQQQPGAKILAGGQSLIPAMRLRLATPEVLVDINRIAGLDYIKEANGYLAIGALTREANIDASDLVHQKYRMLADTAAVIADPLVRNLATVGGNLAHADPANDHPATMLAFGAQVVAVGPKGERTIPIDTFFTGLFENALAKDEILKEIQIPSPPPHSGGAYVKMERKVGDYAVAAVAVHLTLDGNTCKAARIGLTNVSSTPMRAKKAEAALIGKKLDEAAMKAAGEAASAECDPSSDLRGPADYKRDMVRVLTMRAIRKAAERARGGST
jgi:aerobic carbon-monoxide dehydrogenase medium subunit